MKKPLAWLLSMSLCLAPALPAMAADAQVTVSPQTLRVNGEVYKCDKYNIDGYNYFKLRDLACLLDGTGSKFSVGWDAAANTVSIVTGGEYSYMGKEMLLGRDASATAQPTAQTILVNGETVDSLQAYNIGGCNYFRLRDLGDALGFDVDYDADTDTALVRSRPAAWLTESVESTHIMQYTEWDEDDNEITTDIPVAETERYTYTPEGWVATYDSVRKEGDDPEDRQSVTYTYDAQGRMLTRTELPDGAGSKTVNTYDAKGRLVKEETTYGNGRSAEVNEYTYNDKGYVATRRQLSDGKVALTEEYRYDERNNLLSDVTDFGDGDVTESRYTYDEAGNCLTETVTYGPDFSIETVKTYNAAGQTLTELRTTLYSEGDRTVEETVSTYDDAGNEIRYERTYTSVWSGETDRQVTVTEYSYGANGRVLTCKTTDSDGTVTTDEYSYDAAGNMVAWSTVSTDETQNREGTDSYDAAGRILRSEWKDSEGAYVTTFTYDDHGNLLRREESGGSYAAYTYVSLGGQDAGTSAASGAPVIGLAWVKVTDSEFLTNITKAVEAAGGEPVLLPQVQFAELSYTDGKLTEGVTEIGNLTDEAGRQVREISWRGSNAAEVLKGVDAVIFTGGEDISPSLLAEPQPWHGIEAEIDYCAERDISDYLLMDYCLDQDIPFMGFCRGMQMLGVVSGAEIIQDIPTWFAEQSVAYDYTHRNEKETPDAYRNFASHAVEVQDKDSVLYRVAGGETLAGCPSWHHQALGSVEGTALTVTGVTPTCGADMIEAIERSDKSFALGFQFHPEAVVARTLDEAGDTERFMDYDTALSFFQTLVEQAAK